MNSDAKERCEGCGDLTPMRWRGVVNGATRVAALCHSCVEELFDIEIDPYGEEFPDESHDDLLDDDINE
jgi:hypothetical protein